jgi:hypothetical protein
MPPPGCPSERQRRSSQLLQGEGVAALALALLLRRQAERQTWKVLQQAQALQSAQSPRPCRSSRDIRWCAPRAHRQRTGSDRGCQCHRPEGPRVRWKTNLECAERTRSCGRFDSLLLALAIALPRRVARVGSGRTDSCYRFDRLFTAFGSESCCGRIMLRRPIRTTALKGEPKTRRAPPPSPVST